MVYDIDKAITTTKKQRSTSKTYRVHRKCNMVDHKPEVVITLLELWVEMGFQIVK